MQARNGSLFPSAIFTLYCTYLCYSALVSEPHDYICNGLGQRINAASATTLATGEQHSLPYLMHVVSMNPAGCQACVAILCTTSAQGLGQSVLELPPAPPDESHSVCSIHCCWALHGCRAGCRA